MLAVLQKVIGFLRAGSESPELYFHSPCFDGIASAVLALDFLEARKRWSSVQLRAANYDAQSGWLKKRLVRRAAVVDFLYHPDARLWADHHATTFSAGGELTYKNHQSSLTVYDAESPSCALLLQRMLEERHAYRNNRYDSLVEWATKIDAARYESVQEALFGEAPALRINLALLVGQSDYPEQLVRALRNSTLDDVAEQPETDAKFHQASISIREGLEQVRQSVKLDSFGIITFDIVKGRGLVHRYAPYYFFPKGFYSVGITRSAQRITITSMRNPWLEFESINLGELFTAFGGGGHQRVAAVSFTDENANELATRAIASILASIRESLAGASEHNLEAAHAS